MSLAMLDSIISDVNKLGRVIFISGHLDIEKSCFETHYIPKIKLCVSLQNTFVIGDASGTNTMAQQCLHDIGYKHVIIYHMFETARVNIGKSAVCGGFQTDQQRDKAMTEVSDDDIVWIRSIEESKMLYGKKFKNNRISGSIEEQNLTIYL